MNKQKTLHKTNKLLQTKNTQCNTSTANMLQKPFKRLRRATRTPKTIRNFSSTPQTVTFTLEGPENYSRRITSPVGRNLQKVLSASKIAMLPAVCNGQLQCSTCHVKLAPDLYFSLPQPDFPERDILDIAADVEECSSRLACQLKISSSFEGQVLTIPDHFINHMDDPTATPVKSKLLADHV